MSNPFDTVAITDDAGAVVISIETLRRARYKREDGKDCRHRRVFVDPVEAWFTCQDCKEKINPNAWVMLIAEEWEHVKREYKAARHEHARLDLRQWIVCRCGERIRLYSRPEDEKKRKASRMARLEEALEHIAVLTPEAAAKYAAEAARKALAARVAEGGE